MTRYFLDTSAIAKRYVFELGQQWMSTLCEPAGRHELYLSELALVEVVNVVCVKADINSQGMTPRRRAHIRTERDDLIATFLGHCDPVSGQYLVHVMDSGMYDTAVRLRMRYSIQSGDALQLACALEIRTDALGSGTNPPEFLCADRRLREAANSEGFTVRNPEDYAEPHEVIGISRAPTPTTPERDSGWRRLVHAAGKWLAAR